MENILLEENNLFSEKDFKTPQNHYSPTYNWIWNGPLSHEETDRQLDEFERLGIKAICMVVEPKDFRPTSMPTLLAPDYLTKPYFEEYRYAVSQARARGMYVWLYDEGGWPSGGACGRVMLNHPEYARRILAIRETPLCRGESYKAQGDTLSAYVNDAEISDGFTAEKDCTVCEYYEKTVRFENPGIPELPDITRKEAVDCFIDITHEAYKPYLGEFFGNTALAVFSDEPKGPAPIPFRAELEEAFEKEYGYSIRPFLPGLLTGGDLTEDAAKAKIAWLDMCSKFLCKNYFLNEKAWSNKNGMLFTGHVGGDHSVVCSFVHRGYYHLMRALRCFDIPGIDAIWRQIYPTYTDNGRDETDCNNGIFPRYAASAAAQISSRRALTESMGVYGAGTTPGDMRYVFNYQAVRGINVFNVFGSSYSRCGFHMTGEMPMFTEKHACYRDLPSFNRFAERLAYLASLGERVADVGYYMPVGDLWVEGKLGRCARRFEELGRQLEDENILFDIIDDDVLDFAQESAASGVISMGKGRYSTIIVPECRYMPQRSAEVLSRFIEGGGKVFVVSDREVSGIRGAVITQTVKNIIPRALEISGETEKIRLGVRQADNGRLYILFNESNEERTFTVETDGKLTRLFAESGRIVTPSSYVITLQCGESAFLFDGETESDGEPVYIDCMKLDGEYSFRKTNRFVIGDMDFISEDIDEPEQKAKLGDWSGMTGVGFSGSGIYKTTFKRPKKAGTILLELGEVRYTCEVTVNKTSLGVISMSPYSIEIPAEMLSEDNELEIRVTNTAANEYESTTSFDKWGEWQLSSYHKTQKLYHADSLSGGLVGPVVIRY